VVNIPVKLVLFSFMPWFHRADVSDNLSESGGSFGHRKVKKAKRSDEEKKKRKKEKKKKKEKEKEDSKVVFSQ